MTDQELLAAIAAGDSAGMEALLGRYGPLLRYVIGGILSNREDREDCYSEVSLALWRSLERYDPEKGSLSGLLTAVARNTALNHLKARRRREAYLSAPGDGPIGEPSTGETAEDALLRRERAERLQAAVDRLDRLEKQLFYRKYYYLQSTAQMAAELGLTERAVEGRLYRLRNRLRTLLGGELP